MVGRGWVSWLLAGVVTSLLMASCGDTKKDNQPSTMTDGGSNAAAGRSSDAGGDGPVASAGGENAGGRGGIVFSGNGTLGRHCTADEDCKFTLKCLGADQDYPGGTGAPPHGMCTLDCEKDDDCRPFGETAVCGTLDEAPIMLNASMDHGRRLCMQGCTFGAPSGESKCWGQRDMACRPFAIEPAVSCLKAGEKCPDGTFCFRGACREAACGPRCNTDADCAEGRSCNAYSGLCDEGSQPAVPIGAECPGDEDPNSTVCGNGTCLLLSADGVNVKRMCTQTCTLGTLCGDSGACVFARLDPYAAGDIGYCVQRCNCNADCLHPDDHCYPWETSLLADHFQSRGICDASPDQGGGGAGGAAPDDGSLTSCESGVGGAGGNANEAGSPSSAGLGGQGGQKN